MYEVFDFLIQSVSAGCLFWGLWQMGNKRLRGPAIVVCGEAAGLVVGLMHGVWSLILISIVLFFIQGRNLVKWWREGVDW